MKLMFAGVSGYQAVFTGPDDLVPRKLLNAIDIYRLLRGVRQNIDIDLRDDFTATTAELIKGKRHLNPKYGGVREVQKFERAI